MNPLPVTDGDTPRISWGYRLAAALTSLLTSLFLFMILGCLNIGFWNWGKDGCVVETPVEIAVLAFLVILGLMTFPLLYVVLIGRSPLPKKVNDFLTSQT